MIVPLGNSDKVAIVDDEWAEDVLCQKWYLNNQGYVRSTVQSGFPEYGQIFLQKLIMGEPSAGLWIDHIDGDKLNNRTQNLRFVTPSQSGCNRPVGRNNPLGVRGVRFQGRKRSPWGAKIRLNNKWIYLGWFQTFPEACFARKIAERVLFGEYARK